MRLAALVVGLVVGGAVAQPVPPYVRGAGAVVSLADGGVVALDGGGAWLWDDTIVRAYAARARCEAERQVYAEPHPASAAGAAVAAAVLSWAFAKAGAK